MAPCQPFEITQPDQRALAGNCSRKSFAIRYLPADSTDQASTAGCRAAEIQYLPGRQEKPDLMHSQYTAPSQGRDDGASRSAHSAPP
jgi:hypothetical protein